MCSQLTDGGHSAACRHTCFHVFEEHYTETFVATVKISNANNVNGTKRVSKSNVLCLSARTFKFRTPTWGGHLCGPVVRNSALSLLCSGSVPGPGTFVCSGHGQKNQPVGCAHMQSRRKCHTQSCPGPREQNALTVEC